MKFSDLHTETKEHARAALSAVIAKGPVSSADAKIAGETVAAAFIAMEQFESDPGNKSIIGRDGHVSIHINNA
ncbi:hypothetical protein [Serratia liquefaciens]|uniref:hypothetical protein n=1 Tax=Serratia liquefaciens TaxID=614 RepID=UPI003905DF09